MEKRVIDKPLYLFKGKTYTSKSKLSEATGINRKTLNRLIKENSLLTIDEIVEQYKETQIPYKYEGKTYQTIDEVAEDIGLIKRQFQNI